MPIHRQHFRFLQFNHIEVNERSGTIIIYKCCSDLCPCNTKAALFTQWMCLCPISNVKRYKGYDSSLYVGSQFRSIFKAFPQMCEWKSSVVCKIKKELLLTHYHSTRGKKRFQLFVQQRLDGLLLRYVRNVAVCVL